MGLLSDLNVKIDGDLIKGAFEGISGFARTIREVLTGEASPEKKLEALQKLDELEQAIKVGQIEINKLEAAHASIFVAGWRPFIGWICGISLGTYYVPMNLAAAIIWFYQCSWLIAHAADPVKVVLPEWPIQYNLAEMFQLLLALLGFGYMRMKEKESGVARS